MIDVAQQLTEGIRAARAAGTRLRIRGGGSKDFYGNAPQGEPLDTREYHGIVAYEPTELVITARAGTPLTLLESTLAAQNQMLAFEPPHFGDSATFGGCVASGLAGPRRAAYGYSFGAVRDFVLGATLLDGQARTLKFGGTVMKNVAGYDVSRLLAGSMGVLGVILELSLKVLPVPVATTSRAFDYSEALALQSLADWGRKPLPISASSWHDGVLRLRLSGAEAAVKAAVATLGGDTITDAEAASYWRSVREQTLGFFGSDLPLWRCSLPLNSDALQLPGAQLLEWGGALRWLRSAAPAVDIRARVAALGGHVTLFRGGHRNGTDRGAGDSAGGVFQPLSVATARIHERLLDEFDPQRVFDTGRLLQKSGHANHAR
jgi:glycolate oxidase FAD binding subunit